jgi:peptidoglycan/LPS O-acetylase OafA/YrhL
LIDTVPSRTNKIYPLTSVRFLTASFVVFHHSVRFFFSAFARTEFRRGSEDAIRIVAFSFPISVSFFFFLSGYVLASVYLRGGRAVASRDFLAARFARLYPLYLLVLVLDTPEFLIAEVRRFGIRIGAAKTAEIFAGNMLLLQSWWSSRLLRINLPSWSLCSELFFYLCFPTIGFFLWKLRGRELWIMALCLYFGGQALVWLARPHFSLESALCLPPLHLSTFALGILFAKWNELRWQERRGADVPAWQANTVLVLSLAGLFLSVPLVPWFRVAAPYNNGMLVPIFAGIIWGLSAMTGLSRSLSQGWFVAVGNSSYALYLIHSPLLSLFVHLHWATAEFYVLYLALCVGLSVLSFYYFETPVRLWLLKWYQSRRRTEAAYALQ